MKAFKGKYINLSKIEQELIWGKQQTAKKKKKKSLRRGQERRYLEEMGALKGLYIHQEI